METKIKKSYFVFASIFMILYPMILYLIMPTGIIENMGKIDLKFFISFPMISNLIAMFAIGCLIIAKKNNIIMTILMSFCAAINIFWLLTSMSNIIYMTIANLSATISSILLLIFSVFSMKKRNANVLKLWFLPVIFSIFEFLLSWFVYNKYFGLQYMTGGNYFKILGIIKILGIAFIALSFKEFSKMTPDKEYPKQQSFEKNERYGYCDMTKHILLLVFIGWIWQYIWIYRTTDYLNKTPNVEKRDLATNLLLCMFIPFYYIYWIYQSARRIEIMAKEKNIDSDIVILSTVLSLFIGIIPPILMQNKINQICRCENNTISAHQTNTIDSKDETNSDKTDEIRNYKKLLDDGIITEEEFETKKKQLLGI